jgi:crotonobetainyl-CoA:carnitine CoA-transferase CaiB-like acyl-CoA transferase
MFSAVDDDAFARFCAVAGCGDIASDARFSTAKSRAEHRAELEALLEPIFLTRTAAEWQKSLLGAGVGCVQADVMSHFAFLYKDPQSRAIDMMTVVEHPSLGGAYWRYAPVLQFSDTPSRALPVCELGDYTRAILTELGYDQADIDRLHDDKAVGWPAEAAAVTTSAD